MLSNILELENKPLVLSLWQPWAWLVVYGHKPVENRTWKTKVRGQVLIHATNKFDASAFEQTESGHSKFGGKALASALPFPPDMPKSREDYEYGGIVGIATITDCVTESDDAWFFGPYGFVLTSAEPLPFVACRGYQRFFRVSDEVLKELGLVVPEYVQLELIPEAV
jgi:hypothetical protein